MSSLAAATDRSLLRPRQRFDVAVLGSGLSGLGAAWTAAQAGSSVRVIEKASTFGGSSAMSAGMFWTAPSFASFERRIPLGDKALGARLVADYAPALQEIRSSGVSVADTPNVDVMTFGIGYSFDIRSYLKLLTSRIEAAGSVVTADSAVSAVTRIADGGFDITIASADGRSETITATAIVIATGGFQGSRELLAAHMGPNAGQLVHRSNATSAGDGLAIARGLGAASAGDLGTFYGHLLPSPMTAFSPENFLPYSQYYSERTILVNREGKRFVNEFLGDELLNQDLSMQPGGVGVLVFDQHVRATHATAEPFPGLGVLDRYQAGVDAGARHAESDTLDGLLAQAEVFGISAEALTQTVHSYVDAVTAGRDSADGVAVSAGAIAPKAGPFFAIEVQPSITFTFGGIRIDDASQALDEHGAPLAGLFAAGADIGGLSNYGYAGGLAPAYVTGRWAGASAAAFAAESTTTAAAAAAHATSREQ